ncbi:sugar transferase [Candidatus Poribacteria bacterium]|nr:sugar transferase [Candidatus Poribacteria bacterium]
MLKEHASLSRQFAITVDAITVVAAFILSFYVRRTLLFLVPFGVPTSLSDYALLLIVISIIWWALLNVQNAYTWQRFTSLKTEYQRVFKTTVLGTLILIAVIFIFRLRNLPRSLIVLFTVLSFLLLVLEKTLLYHMIGRMRKRGRNRKKVLIVGIGKLAEEFATIAGKYTDWGLEVIGFLTDKSEETYKKPSKFNTLNTVSGCSPIQNSNIKVLGTYDDLLPIIHDYVVEEVVLALPTKDLDLAHKLLTLCEQEGVKVRLISDFFRTMIAKLHVSEIHGIPILTFSTAPIKEWQQFIKRCIDVVVSIIALVVLSPFFLIISALIKLTSPGPAFYEWNVIGFNKKPFKGYKFRSMIKDAEKLKEKLLAQNEMTGPMFKMRNDPRVTPIGRFLRKFSFDELPQLWSVLKGDMSLVGPRPCLQTELPHFESWQRRKFSVKPGLTCLWQVSGRNDIKDFNEWAKMDLEYIDNWSLWLDFKILLNTVPVVLLGKGAR